MSFSKLAPLALPLLLACGADESPLAASDEAPLARDEPAGAVACTPTDVRMAAGGERVSRTAALYVTFDGEAPDDLRLWIEAPGGKHAGETFVAEGRATFLPLSPFAADVELTWKVRMCGDTVSGTVMTGALLHSLSEAALEQHYVGQRFALDLRAGAWLAPAAAVDNEALRFSLGGALLVDVLERERDTLRVAVSAALADNAGNYVSDARVVAAVVDLPLADNPYVPLELEALTVPTTHGDVAVRDMRLSLGLGADGFDDARLEGALDVGSEAACALLEGDDDGSCAPCREGGEESCLPLVVEGLFGLRL